MAQYISSIKNASMFELAKNEGEVAFIEAINDSIHKPIDICQSFGDDDKKRHFDVKMLEYDELLKTYAWHYVDVKDVEEKNFTTGNYVLSLAFLEFHKDYKPYGYYVAFRLVENNTRSKKFILVNTQEMLNACKLINIGEFALVRIKDVAEKCNYRLVVPE